MESEDPMASLSTCFCKYRRCDTSALVRTIPETFKDLLVCITTALQLYPQILDNALLGSIHNRRKTNTSGKIVFLEQLVEALRNNVQRLCYAITKNTICSVKITIKNCF